MLHALTSLFRSRRGMAPLEPRRDTAQLELAITAAAPRDASELLARLRHLGLRRATRVELTRNRRVMVSHASGTVRVHEGYLRAPEPVLRAIVTFLEGRGRAERLVARRTIVSHPVHGAEPARPRAARRERTHPDDAAIVARLEAAHREYNARLFGGALRPIAIRVSRRMTSRLGHYSPALGVADEPEIAMSRRHLRRHGWDETLHTLLHEMVHQWQDESGHPVDHGATFRGQARAVGVAPFARRRVD